MWQMRVPMLSDEWRDIDEARVDAVVGSTAKVYMAANPGVRIETDWGTEYRYQSEAMQAEDRAYEAEKARRDTAPVVEPFEDWREQLGL